ncbi:MAG: hypothetical protein ACN6PF_19685, partial [Achromobacter veterisilvae]
AAILSSPVMLKTYGGKRSMRENFLMMGILRGGKWAKKPGRGRAKGKREPNGRAATRLQRSKTL